MVITNVFDTKIGKVEKKSMEHQLFVVWSRKQIITLKYKLWRKNILILLIMINLQVKY